MNKDKVHPQWSFFRKMVIEFLKMFLSFLSVIKVLKRNVNFFSMPGLVNLVVLNCIDSGNVTVLEHLTYNPKIKGLSLATVAGTAPRHSA